MDTPRARALLAQAGAQTARGFTLLSDADIEKVRAVVEGRQKYKIAPAAFEWSPVLGELVLVLVGRAADSSRAVGLYPLPDGSYHVAFEKREPYYQNRAAPLGYRDLDRETLQWTGCWECPAYPGSEIAFRRAGYID